jgi:hypothetical protein
MRRAFDGSLRSRTLLLVAGVAALLLPRAANAQLIANIIEPSANATATESLYVRATVSSIYEVSTVTAEVEGRQINLKFAQGLNAWTNTLPLTGIGFGSHMLVVNVRDIFGATGQGFRSFRIDYPPVLTVSEPINGTVVQGGAKFAADATDDSGRAIIRVNLIGWEQTGTNEAQGTFPVFPATVAPGPMQMVFEAGDGNDSHRVITSRKIIYEPSSNLTQTVSAPGTLFDFDQDRILYSFQDSVVGPNVIPQFYRPEPRILDRHSGAEISSLALFPYLIGGLEGSSVFIASGLLVPDGALLSASNPYLLVGWSGTTGTELFQRITPLSEKPQIVGTTLLGYHFNNVSNYLTLLDVVETNKSYEFFLPVAWSAVLAPNLDLIYSATNTIFLNRPADPANPYVNRTTTTLVQGGETTKRDGVVTDGINIAYLGHVSDPPGIKTQIITSTGEETLAASPTNGSPTVLLNGGWAAYTKPGPSGLNQIWTRSPNGTQQQRTFFNVSSQLESLGSNGAFTFKTNNTRLVSWPGLVQPLWVNSGQGRARWDNGRLLVILGRSALEFRIGQLEIAPLPNGATRVVFTGQTGLSYVVQGSPDLIHWSELRSFTATAPTTSWTNPPTAQPFFYRTQLSPAP